MKLTPSINKKIHFNINTNNAINHSLKKGQIKKIQ